MFKGLAAVLTVGLMILGAADSAKAIHCGSGGQECVSRLPNGR